MKVPGSIARALTVALVFLALAVLHLGDLSRAFGHPNANFGLFTDGHIVQNVDPGRAAARAGLRRGEPIDISANDPETIFGAIKGPDIAARPDLPMVVHVLGAHARTVILHASPEPSINLPYVVIRELYLFVPLILGSLLLLVRPSAVTWWFFWLMAATHDPPSSVFYYRLTHDEWQREAADVFRVFIDSMRIYASVRFAFSLAAIPIRGWRIVVVASAIALSLENFAGYIVMVFMHAVNLGYWEDALFLGLVLLALWDAYRHAARETRGKMLWIAAGFAIWTIAQAILSPLYSTGGMTYQAFTEWSALSLLFPALTTYALLSTHVVDIRFAISRTVVYGVLTGGVVAIFAILDLIVTRGISEGRLSLPIDVTVAVAVGFFVKNIHEHVDTIVDRVLFHKRYLAEAAMRRSAKAVLHLHSEAALANYLVELPCTVLHLTGAALYCRAGDRFELEHRIGLLDVADGYDQDHPLCAYLSAESEPVRTADVPTQSAIPPQVVLAVPLTLRRQFARFVLYGSHVDGTDIDSEEVRSLAEMAAGAAVTYDHLAAAALEQELLALRGVSLSPG